MYCYLILKIYHKIQRTTQPKNYVMEKEVKLK